MADTQVSSLPISVIILAQREDERLQQAVASVAWAAQVKVVLTDTPITDFSRVRNEAIEAATQPWVCFLDSDEVTHKQTSKYLEPLLKQTDLFGITIQRRDVFLDKVMKYGEVGQVTIPRMFRKDAVQYERPVHEVPIVAGRVVDSEIVFWHYPHPSITSFLSKVIHYAQIDARFRLDHKQHISAWQVFVWPVGKFLDNFFLKQGCRDGWRGVVYAIMMSTHSFAVRALVWEARHAQ